MRGSWSGGGNELSEDRHRREIEQQDSVLLFDSSGRVGDLEAHQKLPRLLTDQDHGLPAGGKASDRFAARWIDQPNLRGVRPFTVPVVPEIANRDE